MFIKRSRLTQIILTGAVVIAGATIFSWYNYYQTYGVRPSGNSPSQSLNRGTVFEYMAKEEISQYRILAQFDTSNLKITRGSLTEAAQPDQLQSIDNPLFAKASEIDFIDPDEEILGIIGNGEVKVYPLGQLLGREIVNDTLAAEPIAVTFCPLVDCTAVFKRKVGSKVLNLGVSGLLYRSNLVMYDRSDKSLWSQIAGKVSGSGSGSKLEILPSIRTTWEQWRKKYPDSLVLIGKDNKKFVDKRRYVGPKGTRVLVVFVNGVAKAYRLLTLSERESPLKDKIGGRTIFVRFDPKTFDAYAVDEKGEAIPSMIVNGETWSRFYPNSEIF